MDLIKTIVDEAPLPIPIRNHSENATVLTTAVAERMNDLDYQVCTPDEILLLDSSRVIRYLRNEKMLTGLLLKRDPEKRRILLRHMNLAHRIWWLPLDAPGLTFWFKLRQVERLHKAFLSGITYT